VRDLGFSWIRRFTDLRRVYVESQHYLREEPTRTTRLLHSIRAVGRLPSLVPTRDGGPIPWSTVPILEAHRELEDSYWLSQLGFYRNAFVALRGTLELAVLGMHFDTDDEARTKYMAWLKSEALTPRFVSECLRPLFETKRFRLFERRMPYRSRVERILHRLDNFVHSRGGFYGNVGLGRWNIESERQVLNERALERYIALAVPVAQAAATLMLVRYPLGMQVLPLLDKFPVEHIPRGFLDEDERLAVVGILDRRVVAVLQELSDNDKGVMWMVGQISNLPDYATQAEIVERLRRQLKWQRQNKGKLVSNAPPGDPLAWNIWKQDEHYDRFAEWFAEYERRSQAST
jgi:hypothetical protein